MTDLRYTPDQARQIDLTFARIFRLFKKYKVPGVIAAPALMAAAAEAVTQSVETDEYLLREFMKCLQDARARHASIEKETRH